MNKSLTKKKAEFEKQLEEKSRGVKLGKPNEPYTKVVELSDVKQILKQALEEVDLVKCEELGDTFIDSHLDAPVHQWTTIQGMLQKAGYAVVKKSQLTGKSE